MKVSKDDLIFGVILFLGILSPNSGSAQGKRPPSSSSFRSVEPLPPEESKHQSEVVQTALALKKSLEELRVIYEADLQKQKERFEGFRELLEKELISRLELEQAARAVASAEAQVKDVERRIADVDIAMTEALAREQWMKQASVGGDTETAALIRYNGGADWSLARVSQVEGFFMERFGRNLPISAFGQTRVHDEMKFDHKSAVDVSVHPDSTEGRSLMAYLRRAGIPFIAFRARISGSATGPHIHIGKPSIHSLNGSKQ